MYALKDSGYFKRATHKFSVLFFENLNIIFLLFCLSILNCTWHGCSIKLYGLWTQASRASWVTVQKVYILSCQQKDWTLKLFKPISKALHSTRPARLASTNAGSLATWITGSESAQTTLEAFSRGTSVVAPLAKAGASLAPNVRGRERKPLMNSARKDTDSLIRFQA